MSNRRVLVVTFLVLFTAGYMVVDGTRALFWGDYFTIDGELGPWALVVSALGADPRSLVVKSFFVAYGALWLGALGGWAAGRLSRGVMIAFAVGASWYLVIGTLAALAQLPFLLPRKRGSGA